MRYDAREIATKAVDVAKRATSKGDELTTELAQLIEALAKLTEPSEISRGLERYRRARS